MILKKINDQYPLSPHLTKRLEFPGARVTLRPNDLEKCKKLNCNWNVQRGGGCCQNSLRGGKDIARNLHIFSGWNEEHITHVRQFLAVCHSTQHDQSPSVQLLSCVIDCHIFNLVRANLLYKAALGLK